MALEPAILSHTKEQVTSVSNRVYAVKAPQGVSDPYIVFFIVSNSFKHAMAGDSGLTETRVQFSVYGESYAGVKGAVEELKAAYRNCIEGDSEEEMGGEEWVQTTLIANETDFYEDDTDKYHTALDIIFWHVEG